MQVIAHRGASAVAPESTSSAIRQAVSAGVAMVELDVQMSCDGKLVIFHDDRLERTTNGHGRLSQKTFAQLRRLDAGSWFHPRFGDKRILLVSEAMRLVPLRVQLNLELKKSGQGRLLLARLIRLMGHARIQSRILLSSFDSALVGLAGCAKLRTALICRSSAAASLRKAIQLGCVCWHPHLSLVTPARIAAAHAAGLRVNAWTVDDIPTARRLKRWGVDGIFSNDPAKLIKALS